MGVHPTDPDAPGGAPGPSVWSLARLVPRTLGTDPLEVAVELRERYGHVVRIPPVYPGLEQPAYLVTHPDDVRYVLRTHPTEFRGLDVSGAMDFGRVVDDSIVSLTEDTEGGSWVDRLRALAPEFREACVAEHAPRFAAETLVTVDEFEPGGPGRGPTARSSAGRVRGLLGEDDDPARVQAEAPGAVRLLALMRRLSLRLLGVSLLGPDVRAHEAAVVRAVTALRRRFKRRQLDVVAGALASHVPERVTLPEVLGHDVSIPLPGGDDGEVDEAIGTLVEIADAVVARRDRTPRPYDDALAAWLTRPDPATGEVLDRETVHSEAVGMLLAGFGTLSAALTWAVYLAATRPEVQERIHEEATATPLFASLADVRDGGVPAPEVASTLEELSYTRRVWRETLRLYPTLPVFGRMAREPVTLGGYEVEAGAPVLVSPYVTHRDPALWAEPTRFDPSRFTPDAVADRSEFAYYPFSGGPHACLGEALATTEAVTALAALFATHRVELVNVGGTEYEPESGDDPPRPGVDSGINLQPDDDVVVRFVGR